MTIVELLDQFLATAKVVTITTRTKPKLRKKPGCPYRSVTRVCRRNGMIGCSYEACVNRQRFREEQPKDEQGNIMAFHALSLWNGKGVHDTRWTVKHVPTGKRYIVFKPKRKEDGQVVINDELWLDENRNPIPCPTEWLEPSSESKRQQVATTVLWRTIELNNVLAVACDGNEVILKEV